jgi:hypothetical protein
MARPDPRDLREARPATAVRTATGDRVEDEEDRAVDGGLPAHQASKSRAVPGQTLAKLALWERIDRRTAAD